MVYYENKPPFQDYLTKLLLLETIECARTKDVEGLEYIQNILYKLALRWTIIKRPRE